MNEHDQDAEAALATALRHLPPRPPTLDTLRAMATARATVARRHRRLRYAVATAVVFAIGVTATAAVVRSGDRVPGSPDQPGVSTTASPPGAGQPCAMQIQPGPAGSRPLDVAAIDPTGRYLAGFLKGIPAAPPNQDVPPEVAVMHEGRLEIIRLPAPTSNFSGLTAVNSAGTVIGFIPTGGEGSTRAAERSYSWVFRNGKAVRVPVPAGLTEVFVWAINDRGDIVGSGTRPDTVAVPDGAAGTRQENATTALLWRDGDIDRPTVLAGPGGAPARATGIAEDGTIVGTVLGAATSGGTVSWLPYAWRPDGTGYRLDPPDGRREGAHVEMIGIRGTWAYGQVRRPEGDPAAGTEVPVRWNVRTGRATLVTALPPYARPTWISDDGALLVTTLAWAAVVAADGSVAPLEAPAVAGETYVLPLWVARDGRTVAGTATYPSTNIRGPVIWRCPGR